MKWKIFDTEAEARAYSHFEAKRRGFGTPDDVCQYWWTVIETDTGEWAVLCPEGTEEVTRKEEE